MTYKVFEMLASFATKVCFGVLVAADIFCCQIAVPPASGCKAGWLSLAKSTTSGVFVGDWESQEEKLESKVERCNIAKMSTHAKVGRHHQFCRKVDRCFNQEEGRKSIKMIINFISLCFAGVGQTDEATNGLSVADYA